MIICLFIYGLVNESVSSSGYVAQKITIYKIRDCNGERMKGGRQE